MEERMAKTVKRWHDSRIITTNKNNKLILIDNKGITEFYRRKEMPNWAEGTLKLRGRRENVTSTKEMLLGNKGATKIDTMVPY